jgi:hypothetical protein
MNKIYPLLVTTFSLAATACGDDGNTSVGPREDAAVSAETEVTEAPTSASPTSTSDESTTQREGPWGCYLEDHHKCDCSIRSEGNCEGVGLWVEGCATCTPDPEDAGRLLTDDGGGPLSDEGSPDAAVDASTRPEEAGLRDAGSGADSSDGLITSEVSTSTGVAPTGAADAGSGSACYDPDSHECDCETSEEECSAADGIWTNECPCGALDAGQ